METSAKEFAGARLELNAELGSAVDPWEGWMAVFHVELSADWGLGEEVHAKEFAGAGSPRLQELSTELEAVSGMEKLESESGADGRQLPSGGGLDRVRRLKRGGGISPS